ncbi:MAG TPA: oligoendopeptidase F [Chloroflexi bacterium]|nr:oligoendopeptidase F [Chloroflexota bacterium]
MLSVELPPRHEIPEERTWDQAAVFESCEAWEAEYKEVASLIDGFPKRYADYSHGPSRLLETLEAAFRLQNRAERIVLWAGMAASVDAADPEAAQRNSQARGLLSRVRSAVAFLEPALLALGRDTLSQWMSEEPGLAVYEHYFDNLFRRQQHVRSAEVESLLRQVQDPFSGLRSTIRMLTDADFQFAPAEDANGEQAPLSHGTYMRLMQSPDRQLRRNAWESYHDLFFRFRNTLASGLETSIKQSVFLARARHHTSTLEAALSEDNIPTAVFHNLIEVFKANLPTWHRYFETRKRILGVASLQPYDMWAPLTEERPQVSYEEAVEWICEGLSPMGSDYVEAVRRGCLDERWVDVYPNQGKRQGAFSTGVPGTRPYIMMHFGDTLLSLSTLAHELGHSMHSYLSWKEQPLVYSDHSLFIAEVASNFHQAMVRALLLNRSDEPVFRIAVLEEAMSNFYRYFFQMPTLALFEYEIHQRVEAGEGLNADLMIELMHGILKESYGPGVQLDSQLAGMTWATFGHLYVDFYVFQYATGISGAHALARRVLEGEPQAPENYLSFLKLGSSRYPLEALRVAGVDLEHPGPVEATFATMAGYVEMLEQLAREVQSNRTEKANRG